MARAAKSSSAPTEGELEKLTGELTCPVCKKLFKDPKILPCLHCCCRECLEYIIVQSSSQSPPPNCPECHKVMEIPQKDVSKLPTALFLNRLKAVHTVMEKDQQGHDVICEVCQSPSTSPAQTYCRNCGQFMCTTCEKAHKKEKSHTGHNFVKLKKLRQNMTQNIKPEAVKCAVHDKPMKTFCTDCDQLICQSCANNDHKSHKQESIDKTAIGVREGIEQDLSNLHQGQSLVKEASLKANKTRETIVTEANEAKRFVNQCVDGLIHGLQECREEILWSIDQIHDEKLTEISSQDRNLQGLQIELERVSKFVKKCLENSSNEEIVEVHDQLTSKINGETQKCHNAHQHGIPSVEPDTFADLKSQCVSKIAELTSTCTVADPKSCTLGGAGIQCAEVGNKAKFYVNTKQSDGSPCQMAQVVQAELKSLSTCTSFPLKVTPTEKGVYEITYTPKDRGRHLIAVLVNGQPLTPGVVSVLVRPPLTHKIAPVNIIKGVDKLSDIAISQDGQLFATQYKKGCVISLDNEGKRIKTVLSELDRPFGVAIDTSGNTYVTDSREGSLKKYNTAFTVVADLVPSDNNPGRFEVPQRIAVNGKNEIFVCDWNTSSVQVFDGNLQHLRSYDVVKPVSVVCSDKNEVYIIDGSRSSLLKVNSESSELVEVYQGLNNPCGVHIDSDYVYVTERGSKQVTVLTHDGKLVSSFGKGMLKEPGAICGDEEGYLYVCDESVEAIIVF